MTPERQQRHARNTAQPRRQGIMIHAAAIIAAALAALAVGTLATLGVLHIAVSGGDSVAVITGSTSSGIGNGPTATLVVIAALILGGSVTLTVGLKLARTADRYLAGRFGPFPPQAH